MSDVVLDNLNDACPNYQDLKAISEQLFSKTFLPDTFEKLLANMLTNVIYDKITGRIACYYTADENIVVADLPMGTTYDKLTPVDKGIVFSTLFIKAAFPELSVADRVFDTKQSLILQGWKNLVAVIYTGIDKDLTSGKSKGKVVSSAKDLVADYEALLAREPELKSCFADLDELMDMADGNANISSIISKAAAQFGNAVNVYYVAYKAKKYIAKAETEIDNIFATLGSQQESSSDDIPTAKERSAGSFLDLSDL